MAQELYKLPKGWEWKTVKDVSAESCSGFACNKSNEVDDGHVHLRTHNINTSGQLNFDLMVKIDRKKVESKKSNLLAGDILFNNTNSKELVGKTAFVDQAYSYGFSNHLTRIRVHKFCDPKLFVLWFVRLQSSGYFSQICKCWIGQAGINSNILNEIQIPLPPLPEQKRIVAKLDALLSRIAQAAQELQESLALADQLFASALDEAFRNPNESASIEDLAEIKGGKRLPKGHELSDEPTLHPYIRVSDFNDYGSIDVDGVRYIAEDTHNEIKRYIINSDDLYISIAGTIGKTGIIPTELDGANLTENAAKLVIKDKGKLNLQYLYYYTKSRDFEEQAGLATKQVAQPKLALIRLAKIQIPMRPLLEQKRIVQRLESLQAKQKQLKETMNEKIQGLNALKASLLDAAFRGEL